MGKCGHGINDKVNVLVNVYPVDNDEVCIEGFRKNPITGTWEGYTDYIYADPDLIERRFSNGDEN